MAWNAPRILNAPIRWKFSHLNQSLSTGFAGAQPAQGVPSSSAGVRGVDASVLSVVLVRTGVLCI
jgi:hypothetical protein